MLFDVTEMQRINDQRGHEFGNQVLKDIERRLKSSFGFASVIRLRGDEFLVTQPNFDLIKLNAKAGVVAQIITHKFGIELAWGSGAGATAKQAHRAAATDLFEKRRRSCK